MRGYQLAGVDVVAVVDPLDVAREQFQEEYGVAHAYGRLRYADALVPDMVSVCTWHLLHPGPTLAPRSGVKGVICEKPMAVGLGLADEMVDA